MQPLKYPDDRYLAAAEGWLGLSNCKDANEELDKITPALRAHPDVLKARYQVYAQAKKWEQALEIARAIARVAPDLAFGWFTSAFALHELKRPQEARDTLLPVMQKFPREWLMHYNLACYECQLGNLEGAWGWLEKTFDIKDSKDIKLMALDDPDLEPLWANIAEI